ncbi:hypothetical protein LRS11_14785 [Pseudomonas sp. J452]|uniref:hypothetical protein n=1 Tax=Pseudomonas sp. J452 TaxID=2898441 RepID=UPI0021AD5EBF|nr:hypothetical protein [Pseudomonas sp. J452]UUY07090.1 hypothetical protein LRS11_14785 [Pseudomonas sp. J452]
MPSKKSFNIHFELGVFLVFVCISIFAYTALVTSTEVSASSEIIDTRNCYTKNSAFRSAKRICTNYKFRFTYEGKIYIGWSELVRLETETIPYDKVYFSSMRPQATASLRSMADRGNGLIAIALSALALSAYFFYKQSARKSDGDDS